MQEPQIGDKVVASMDKEHWFNGKYEAFTDIFASYGVRCDDGDLRFFIYCEKLKTKETD
jgi:hypothetical protein